MNLNIRISIFEFGYYKFLYNKDPAQGEYKDVVLTQSQKSSDCWWSCKCCNVWQTLSNTHSDLPGSSRSFIRISVSSLSLLAFLLAISALKWEHEPPGSSLRGYHSLCQSFLVIFPPLSLGLTASSLLQSSLALTSLTNLQGEHLVYEHEECWLVVRLSPDRTNVRVVGCESIDITITRWLAVKQTFQRVNRKR